ncbi:hypothetical protein A9Q99_00255 [Gammaproteobacteria bacterium 45_16_T64]|nr:hypothetical protein A9Q99_00255 [Gammaproteobacteria bacterium 45_16_T64]
MTLTGKLITFFPALNVTLVIASFIAFIVEPSLYYALIVLFSIYGFPLMSFHIHQYLCPLKEDTSSIVKGYSAWYGTHMIQNMHITFPAFERLLRIVPGVFSLWLRLWGSKVGKSVHWTTQLEIADRSLIEVGDNCVFGYNVKLSSHVIKPSSEHGMVVYVKRICVRKNSLVGAVTQMAPGVIVEEGALVPALSNLYPDTTIERKVSKKENKQTNSASTETV